VLPRTLDIEFAGAEYQIISRDEYRGIYFGTKRKVKG